MQHLINYKKTPTTHKSVVRTTLQALIIGVSSIAVMSGCQATKNLFGKFDNGSLAYQDSEKLEPLKLPAEQQSAPFTPLYPTPNAGVNTLDLENESGNRFELPPPYRQTTNN